MAKVAAKTRSTREARPAASRLRSWLSTLAWCAVFVSSAMAARKVHQFVITDPQFLLSAANRDSILIQGITYTPRTEVRRLFEQDFGRSIFSIRLQERRRRLRAIDWVQDAAVLRIWPNRLLVRITERKPVAFVNLVVRPETGGPSSVMLIDPEGALLEPPTRARFAFPVLSGVTDEMSTADRRARVQAMLSLLAELGPAAKDISEIRIASFDNVAVIAQVEGRALELILGDGNYARRYQNFLNHYPEIQKRAGNVTTFDLRLDDRITAKE
ncbi:MAG TPA: FtsQ-type POTRA domain-containing protein [Bryobacteraceae bacterium]|nr:FtsQ-type POTRA domain-containing protein [Bryobacteraceae bacterium]